MLLKTVTLQSYTTQSTNGVHLPQSVYLSAHVWGGDGVALLVWLHLLALLPQQAQLPITVMQPLGSGQRHMVTIHKLLSKNDQMIVIHAMLWQKYWELSRYILRVQHHDRLLQTCWVSKIHWYILLLLHWFSAINVLHRVHYGTYCMRGWLTVEAKPSGALALRPRPECTKSHNVHTHFLILYFAGQNIAHSACCGNRHFYLTYLALSNRNC